MRNEVFMFIPKEMEGPKPLVLGTRIPIISIGSKASIASEMEKAESELKAIINEALTVPFVCFAEHRLHIYENWGHGFSEWDNVWRSFLVFEELFGWKDHDIEFLAKEFISTHDRRDQSYYFSYPVYRNYLIDKSDVFGSLPRPSAKRYGASDSQRPIP